MTQFTINYLESKIDILVIISLLFIGFITGILSGLLGIGGGVIFVPTMLIVLPLLGVEDSFVIVSAIATSLFAGSFASASALFNHRRKKNLVLKEGLILGFGAIISASLAPKIIVSLDPTVLKIIISFFILMVAIKLLLTKKDEEIIARNINPYWLFPMGLFFGAIAAISGLGGGIFYVPILLYFLNGDLKLSVGTSTIVILFTMLSSTISFAFLSNEWNSITFQFGYLNVASALLLGVGAIIGAYYGVKLIFKVPIPIFRKIFSLFLLIVVIKIMYGVYF
jgi:uncharacterized membrane protein YfcA